MKWSDGDTNQERNIVVDGDLNITAEFEQNIFMLKYMVEGKEYNSFDLEVGAEIPAVEDPVKEGFKFNGWDGLPETMPANDVTVNALFLQYFKVNISAGEGGTVNFEAKEEGYLDGDEITVTATAADDKFRFVKWSDGVTEATRTISVNSNIDLVAEFEQYLYTITYKVEGKDYKTAKVEKGTAIPAVEDPVKEGFKFNGWEGLPETMPAEDITVNALFLQYFAVAITAGEGGSVDFEAKEGVILKVMKSRLLQPLARSSVSWNGVMALRIILERLLLPETSTFLLSLSRMSLQLPTWWTVRSTIQRMLRQEPRLRQRQDP